MIKKTIYIFTDGACSGNPGPGGWGALLKYGDIEKELSGGEKDTTNNRMELLGAINALKALKKPSNVVLTTDSEYVKNGITKWLKSWKEKGWKTANKQAVKNRDLWEELDSEVNKHEIIWRWVKGHSGHIDNERVDTLARNYIAKIKRE
jgi:ribonuclease HI